MGLKNLVLQLALFFQLVSAIGNLSAQACQNGTPCSDPACPLIQKVGSGKEKKRSYKRTFDRAASTESLSSQMKRFSSANSLESLGSAAASRALDSPQVEIEQMLGSPELGKMQPDEIQSLFEETNHKCNYNYFNQFHLIQVARGEELLFGHFPVLGNSRPKHPIPDNCIQALPNYITLARFGHPKAISFVENYHLYSASRSTSYKLKVRYFFEQIKEQNPGGIFGFCSVLDLNAQNDKETMDLLYSLADQGHFCAQILAAHSYLPARMHGVFDSSQSASDEEELSLDLNEIGKGLQYLKKSLKQKFVQKYSDLLLNILDTIGVRQFEEGDENTEFLLENLKAKPSDIILLRLLNSNQITYSRAKLMQSWLEEKVVNSIENDVYATILLKVYEKENDREKILKLVSKGEARTNTIQWIRQFIREGKISLRPKLLYYYMTYDFDFSEEELNEGIGTLSEFLNMKPEEGKERELLKLGQLFLKLDQQTPQNLNENPWIRKILSEGSLSNSQQSQEWLTKKREVLLRLALTNRLHDDIVLLAEKFLLSEMNSSNISIELKNQYALALIQTYKNQNQREKYINLITSRGLSFQVVKNELIVEAKLFNSAAIARFSEIFTSLSSATYDEEIKDAVLILAGTSPRWTHLVARKLFNSVSLFGGLTLLDLEKAKVTSDSARRHIEEQNLRRYGWLDDTAYRLLLSVWKWKHGNREEALQEFRDYLNAPYWQTEIRSFGYWFLISLNERVPQSSSLGIRLELISAGGTDSIKFRAASQFSVDWKGLSERFAVDGMQINSARLFDPAPVVPETEDVDINRVIELITPVLNETLVDQKVPDIERARVEEIGKIQGNLEYSLKHRENVDVSRELVLKTRFVLNHFLSIDGDNRKILAGLLIDGLHFCPVRAAEFFRNYYEIILGQKIYSNESSNQSEASTLNPGFAFNALIDVTVREFKSRIVQSQMFQSRTTNNQRVHVSFAIRQILHELKFVPDAEVMSDSTGFSSLTEAFKEYGVYDLVQWKQALATMFMEEYTSKSLVKSFSKQISTWLTSDLEKNYPILADTFLRGHLELGSSDFDLDDEGNIVAINLEGAKRLLVAYQYLIPR